MPSWCPHFDYCSLQVGQQYNLTLLEEHRLEEAHLDVQHVSTLAITAMGEAYPDIVDVNLEVLASIHHPHMVRCER